VQALGGRTASQFESYWFAAGANPIGKDSHVPKPPAPRAWGERNFCEWCRIRAKTTVRPCLIDACFHVRDRMLITDALFFVPDFSFGNGHAPGGRRGVTIDLCTASSNPYLAIFARNRALRSLTMRVSTLHLLPYISHERGSCSSDAFGVSGSGNLDSRSLLLNDMRGGFLRRRRDQVGSQLD